MAVLHDELNRLIRELCTDTSVKSELMRSILARRGVQLTDAEFEVLVKAINESSDSDTTEVPIDRLTETIYISSDEIEHALLEFEDNLDSRVSSAINRIVENLVPSILESLYGTLPQALEERRTAQANFEARLYERWQGGLDRLEMLIIIAHEAGEIYVEDLRREFAGEAESEESVLLDALVALHCRACRTAREILCLMKSGYADGAYARWRAIHEMAVTACFLLQHGADTPQRYLDHADVMSWRAAQEYQEHCQTLGYEPFSTKELDELKAASDAVIDKYGPSFKSDYGWAADALGDARPTFRKIEANLDMSEWRPFFRLACQSVHAGSEALLFSLAATDVEQMKTMPLAGASDAGLADPGHHTAISLTMTSVALLTSRPNLDGLVCSKCMLNLCDEIGEVLLEAHESHES